MSTMQDTKYIIEPYNGIYGMVAAALLDINMKTASYKLRRLDTGRIVMRDFNEVADDLEMARDMITQMSIENMNARIRGLEARIEQLEDDK